MSNKLHNFSALLAQPFLRETVANIDCAILRARTVVKALFSIVTSCKPARMLKMAGASPLYIRTQLEFH